MEMLHQDFHEDDDYNRDCTAFKVRIEAANAATASSFISAFLSLDVFDCLDLLIVSLPS